MQAAPNPWCSFPTRAELLQILSPSTMARPQPPPAGPQGGLGFSLKMWGEGWDPGKGHSR